MSAQNPMLPGAGITVRVVRDDGTTFAGVTIPTEGYTSGNAVAKLVTATGLTASELVRARNTNAVQTHRPREPDRQGSGWGIYNFPDQTIGFVQRDDGSHLSWGAPQSLFTVPRAASAIAAISGLTATELARVANMGGPSFAAAAFTTFQNMPQMNAALAAGIPAVLLAGPSDSTGVGYGASAPASISNAANLNAIHGLKLQLTTLGFNVTDDCYSFGDHSYGAGFESIYNGAMTIGSGWALNAFMTPWGAQQLGNSTTTSPISVTARLPWDTCEIFYRQLSGFGVLGVDRGGAVQTVATTAGADGLGRSVFTFPLGSQPINVTRQSGGFVLPLMMRLYNSATQRLVIIDMAAVGGWQTSNWLDSSAGPCSPFTAMQSLRYHGAMIKLGINDKIASVATATFQANLISLVNNIKAATAPTIGGAPDVCLEIPNSCLNAANGDFDSTYITAVGTAATSTSTRTPINLRVPTVTRSDNTHPDGAGYATIGTYEGNQL